MFRSIPIYYTLIVQIFSSKTKKSKKDLLKSGFIKETIGHLIKKFFIYESNMSHKTNSHQFKNMIVGA